MTWKRALIVALDRPGGRALLAATITRMARRSAPGVRAYFHRGMWVHQEGDILFVDSPALDYHPPVFRGWRNEVDRSLADAADHWMHVYTPQAGDLILDIGAGKGEDTLAFSRAVGPTGRVIAIEAHPATFRCLRSFCEWNRLHNVSALNLAITSHDKLVTVGNAESWQANHIEDEGAKGGRPVPGMTLDSLVRSERLSRIDLLKMNIEGAELQAIEGMEETLRITRAVCISCHDFRANQGHGDFFRTKATVQRAIERAGFRIVSRELDPRPYVADQVNAVARE